MIEKVKFAHVKTHMYNRNNLRADELAKEVIGLDIDGEQKFENT